VFSPDYCSSVFCLVYLPFFRIMDSEPSYSALESSLLKNLHTDSLRPALLGLIAHVRKCPFPDPSSISPLLFLKGGLDESAYKWPVVCFGENPEPHRLIGDYHCPIWGPLDGYGNLVFHAFSTYSTTGADRYYVCTTVAQNDGTYVVHLSWFKDLDKASKAIVALASWLEIHGLYTPRGNLSRHARKLWTFSTANSSVTHSTGLNDLHGVCRKFLSLFYDSSSVISPDMHDDAVSLTRYTLGTQTVPTSTSVFFQQPNDVLSLLRRLLPSLSEDNIQLFLSHVHGTAPNLDLAFDGLDSTTFHE
jgi:hypothetical protein